VNTTTSSAPRRWAISAAAFHVIDHAEKVGRLNDHRGGLVVDLALQFLQVDSRPNLFT